MIFTVRTLPKVKEVAKVKDLYPKEQKIEPKKLYYAVAGGSIPPGGNNPDPFKKELTPEQIAKIMELVGNNNKIGIKSDYYNKIFKKPILN